MNTVLTKTLQIGSLNIQPPLLLAPMEDVTKQPFRRIVKKIGQPGLMFTEFVNAMAIHHNAKKTYKKMFIHPDERPIGIQISGGNPVLMANTARIAEEMGADLIDINMGCWVPKVCKTGSGAALLKDPAHAEKIVDAVVKAVNVPVTVKVRAGWDYSLFAAPELAKRFEAVGAQMITLHARFAPQGMDGNANWKLIEELKNVIKIPVIGNGDIKTPEDAFKMLTETGCDGVMVGRGAISNPWAIARIRTIFSNESVPKSPALRERIDVALEHARLTIAFQAGAECFEQALELPSSTYTEHEFYAMKSLRGQIVLYIKGEPGAAQLRGKLTNISSYKELEEALENFYVNSSSCYMS